VPWGHLLAGLDRSGAMQETAKTAPPPHFLLRLRASPHPASGSRILGLICLAASILSNKIKGFVLATAPDLFLANLPSDDE